MGHGGTAIVYLARDLVTGKKVALKVLRAELSESLSSERFLREIRVTQRLSHPNIAPVLESGAAGATLYCVLEYMDGGTLRARLQRERQLPLSDVSAIAAGIGAALEYAHGQKIIHRDVKPENILFGDGRAWLADFGIARALENAGDGTTSTGIVRGTPAYMSPEQASGERDYDGRSDVYSFACVVYEAIAGMPAFVGPNVQAVLAQRLVHVPRSVRVYRPAVSAELEAVLARALAVAPADRYQTAAEFTRALRSAIDTPSGTFATAHADAQPRRARYWLWAAGLAAVAGIGFILGPLHGRAPWARRAAPDTTVVAVLPSARGEGDAALLFRGLQRWRDVTLADPIRIDAAIRRNGGGMGDENAAAVAAAAGAGRYVRIRLDSSSAGRTAYAGLYGLHGEDLYHAQLPFSADTAAALATFAALADSLLLHGAVDDGPDAMRPGSRSLLATQWLLAGRRALDDWDLAAADSFFARAGRADPGSGRPPFWLAQTREWAGDPATTWLPMAHAAAARTASLAPVERQMSAALVALGDGDYPAACHDYHQLIAADARSFAGWYGQGECNKADPIVVPDPRTASHWRRRSSYEQAVRGYVKAFELRPGTYRSFQPNAYARLRLLLLISIGDLLEGTSADRTGETFLGYPIVAGDTIAVIPVPEHLSLAAHPVVSLADHNAAARRFRKVFSQITVGWAHAAPASAEAMEGLAVGLELSEDPSAADSFAVAQRLATDPLQRLRLAAARAYVLVKLGVPDDTVALASARRIADSLLRAPHSGSASEADILAPMAALAGRCHVAAQQLRIAATPFAYETVEIPRYLVATADSMLAMLVLGCSAPPPSASLVALASRLNVGGLPDSSARRAESYLLNRVVRIASPPDPVWIARLATTGDYLLAAEHEFLSGRASLARQQLLRVVAARAGANATPDGAFPDAQLWLAMGDTVMALATLRNTLDFTPGYPPMIWIEHGEAAANVVTIATMIRAMALCAEISGADRISARRWSVPVATLWTGADPELQSIVRTMRGLVAR